MNPIFWIDTQIQSAVDSSAHWAMNTFGVRKSVVRYCANTAVVLGAILSAMIDREVGVLGMALVWMYITHKEERQDNDAESSGSTASMADAFTEVPAAVLLGKLMWIGAAGYDYYHGWHATAAVDLVVLFTVHLGKTSPNAPPPKEKRELVPARARA